MLAQLADRAEVRERTRFILLPLSFNVPWMGISHFEPVSSGYRGQKGMVQTGMASLRDGPLGYTVWSLEQQQEHLFNKQPSSKQYEQRAEEQTRFVVSRQQRPEMFKETVKEKSQWRTEALKERPPKWHKKMRWKPWHGIRSTSPRETFCTKSISIHPIKQNRKCNSHVASCTRLN